MKRYTLGVIMITLLITGCGNHIEKATVQKRGEARRVVFIECMELAAKMPRQADDDVSDIVEKCTSTSYYLTNYIE